MCWVRLGVPTASAPAVEDGETLTAPLVTVAAPKDSAEGMLDDERVTFPPVTVGVPNAAPVPMLVGTSVDPPNSRIKLML